MSLPGQIVNPGRYLVSPRTLSFLTHQDQVLLQKIPVAKRAWAGLWNGIGGHIESSEDIFSSAMREIMEESSIDPQGLRLVGINMIDLKDAVGITTYVFMGIAESTHSKANAEGELAWIPINALNPSELVDDVPELISRGLSAYHGNSQFYGLYTFDEDGSRQASFT